MTDAVRDAYDSKVREYADFNLDDLDRVPVDREWLEAFARLASPGAGVVAGRPARAVGRHGCRGRSDPTLNPELR